MYYTITSIMIKSKQKQENKDESKNSLKYHFRFNGLISKLYPFILDEDLIHLFGILLTTDTTDFKRYEKKIFDQVFLGQYDILLRTFTTIFFDRL